MSLEQLPINLFDLVVIVVLALGIFRGRKHGMSEELLSVATWLAILFGCAALYQPGGELLTQFTSIFGRIGRRRGRWASSRFAHMIRFHARCSSNGNGRSDSGCAFAVTIRQSTGP